MKKHAAMDTDGSDLRIGDWVRVLTVPLSIKGMRDETKKAFSRAVGNTFQIEAFDETGCIELFMWPKSGWDTIWVEPYCVRRFRRYKRLSKSFRKTLERRSTPPPPRYEIEFDIGFKEGVDIEEFGHHLTSFASGGGSLAGQTKCGLRALPMLRSRNPMQSRYSKEFAALLSIPMRSSFMRLVKLSRPRKADMARPALAIPRHPA